MLEQLISLESLVPKKIEKSYFIAGDLERLSASVLYTSDLPPMTSAGCFDPNFRRESFSQPAWSNIPRAESSPQNYEVKPLFLDGTTLSGTQGSQKIVDGESYHPLMRLDRKDDHKDFDHIHYGMNKNDPLADNPYRNGEEARKLFEHVILKKLGIDLDED